jgi:nucleoside phosphorylase
MLVSQLSTISTSCCLADAYYRIGSPHADYAIDWSSLDRPYEGCDFANLSVTRGKFITTDMGASIGNKDRAVIRQADTYRMQLNYLSKKHVVLYDVKDRRAWLVDGASALLHLVRASLKDNENDKLKDSFLFKWEEMMEAPAALSGTSAAINVLMNESNRYLKLYINTESGWDEDLGKNYNKEHLSSNRRATYFHFKDRVGQIYCLLEQCFTYQLQMNMDSLPGSEVNKIQRPCVLEGFDFMDVATEEDQFWPRVIPLPSTDTGWINFTRAIHAITLFGHGFGELIKPTDTSGLCPSWIKVPREKDYLTVGVSHIMEILKKRGNKINRPWKVVEGIFWHNPDKIFDICKCTGNISPERCCDRAQALIPKHFRNLLGNTISSPPRLNDSGAVIFSHSWDSAHSEQFHLSKEASFALAFEQSGSPYPDSGLGQSLSPSASQDQGISTGTPRKRPYGSSNASDLPSKRLVLSDVNVSATDDPPLALSSLGRSGQHKETGVDTSQGKLSEIISTNKGKHTSHGHGTNHRPSEGDYTVGWICAIGIELRKSQKMFDEIYKEGYGHGADNNLYTLGRIGHYNVVMCCLPKGQYGTCSATKIATRMMNKFPKIKIGLLVGIAGGLPNENDDIRLGDVIVSTPNKQHGGVVQYDMGKVTIDGFQRTGYLNAPPEKLLAALNKMPSHGTTIENRPSVSYPGESLDRLYKPTYAHVAGNKTCKDCDEQQLLERDPGNRGSGPHVFYGTIASGDSVIKDAATRDMLVQRHQVLCFEMEAAGLMCTNFPCLVVRGISDYADSHKNDEWASYAAAAAATYAKDFLCTIPGEIGDFIGS